MVVVPGDRQEPVKAEADQGHGGQVEGEPSDEHLEAFQKVVHEAGALFIWQTGPNKHFSLSSSRLIPAENITQPGCELGTSGLRCDHFATSSPPTSRSDACKTQSNK